jgi:hypothetical protein
LRHADANLCKILSYPSPVRAPAISTRIKAVNFRFQERSRGMWIFIAVALIVKLYLIFAIFG